MSETEYIMKPDEDLRRAISIDELIQGVKMDIHEILPTESKMYWCNTCKKLF